MTENLTVAWLTGRNICRRHCMDLVSIGKVINSRFEMVHNLFGNVSETSEENDFIKGRILQGGTRFIWTSGRKCNFKGCNRADLLPSIGMKLKIELVIIHSIK